MHGINLKYEGYLNRTGMWRSPNATDPFCVLCEPTKNKICYSVKLHGISLGWLQRHKHLRILVQYGILNEKYTVISCHGMNILENVVNMYINASRKLHTPQHNSLPFSKAPLGRINEPGVFGATSSDTMMTIYQMDPFKTKSVIYQIDYDNFRSTKCIFKKPSGNSSCFVQP